MSQRRRDSATPDGEFEPDDYEAGDWVISPDELKNGEFATLKDVVERISD